MASSMSPFIVPIRSCTRARPSLTTISTRPAPTGRHSGPHQIRTAVNSANAAKYKRKDAPSAKKKKKTSTVYKSPDLRQVDRFALIDAMRYIRAFEVGRSPISCKYELHLRLRTQKSGPVVRNRLRLPHPVDTSLRVCVICPPGSKHEKAAKSAGAVLIGEDTVFETIKSGKLEFERCICHQDSLQKLNQAGLGRVLGPRGLMPSAKLGTVVKDVAAAVRDMSGGSEYRERAGVVRMAIGQLGFTPEDMQRNIRSFMEAIRRDCATLSDRAMKEIHEVVLSSTNAPGFTLNGEFSAANSLPTSALST